MRARREAGTAAKARAARSTYARAASASARADDPHSSQTKRVTVRTKLHAVLGANRKAAFVCYGVAHAAFVDANSCGVLAASERCPPFTF